MQETQSAEQTTDQTTDQTGASQQQSLQLGFGQALTIMYGANWRETASESQINVARFFYNQGLQAMQTLVVLSNQELSQRLHAVMATLAVGAEKQLAEQAEATKAAEKPAKLAKKAAASPKAKTLATKKAKK